MASRENMKIKVFAYQGPAFWFFRPLWIRTDKMELEIQDWLAKNPGINVHEVKHDLAQHILMGPLVVVSIYYSNTEV